MTQPRKANQKDWQFYLISEIILNLVCIHDIDPKRANFTELLMFYYDLLFKTPFREGVFFSPFLKTNSPEYLSTEEERGKEIKKHRIHHSIDFPVSSSLLHLILNASIQAQDGHQWVQPHTRKENTNKMKHVAKSQKQRNQVLEIAMIIPLWLVIATCLTFT